MRIAIALLLASTGCYLGTSRPATKVALGINVGLIVVGALVAGAHSDSSCDGADCAFPDVSGPLGATMAAAGVVGAVIDLALLANEPAPPGS